jgi:hypothetical protein
VKTENGDGFCDLDENGYRVGNGRINTANPPCNPAQAGQSAAGAPCSFTSRLAEEEGRKPEIVVSYRR